MKRLVETAQKVLPHPSFVYCAQYHPSAPNLVVSGSYDCLIRVWRLDVDDVSGQLLQEFEGHSSFINTLCFDFEGSRMFSADNTGLIIVWKTSVNESMQIQKPCHHWSIEKKVDESDLRGVAINLLQLHPNGRCLLIHAKDSLLRMMDLRMLAVKKYTGVTNYRERIYSTFTPCGTFIFSGSEDGMAYVWNTDTGDQVAVYSELCYHTALHGVSFHPYENMVAFCACGQNQPVHVYLYDHKVSQLELQSGAAVSRSASAERTLRNTPDSLPPLQDTSVSSALDHFTHTARLVMKRQFVKEHLDSVLEPHRRSSASGFISDHDKMGIRSCTSDSDTMGLNPSLPPQSLLSPHSKLQIIPPAALGTQTHECLDFGAGFPVSQHLKGASAFWQQTTLSDHISSESYVETGSLPVQQVVVSLYDYRADSSDELTIRRGDVIQVLFKDKENDTRWFGRMVSGLQGYFPASYVVDQSEFREEAADFHTAVSDRTTDRTTSTRVSAAITSSGNLTFLSEPAFSDTETELTSTKMRRKRRVKKPGQPATAISQTDPSGQSKTRSRGRPTDRPLPKRPVGWTNRAFEPDT